MMAIERPLDAMLACLAKWQRQGLVQKVNLQHVPDWPAGRSLVLAEDVALELGGLAPGSAAFIAWSAEPARDPDMVVLVGPEPDRSKRTLPLVLCALVRGELGGDAPQQPYDRYLDMEDAVFSTALSGVTLRWLPSQQRIRILVGARALSSGFSLAHLGAAMVRRLGQLSFVHQVALVLVTGPPPALDRLAPVVCQASRAVAALARRAGEEHQACTDCDLSDICDARDNVRL